MCDWGGGPNQVYNYTDDVRIKRLNIQMGEPVPAKRRKMRAPNTPESPRRGRGRPKKSEPVPVVVTDENMCLDCNGRGICNESYKFWRTCQTCHGTRIRND